MDDLDRRIIKELQGNFPLEIHPYDEASELISSYPQITHSYLREDTYNIWFTVIAESRNRILAILEEIRQKLELSEDDVMDLPVEKLFKLDARFK
jgi:DNA-binding Lrp family transcriptional regulator